MLIITRRPGEKIMLGDDIVVEVMEVSGFSVRVGIPAPRSVPVYREEIWRSVKEENAAAAAVDPDQLPSKYRPAQPEAAAYRRPWTTSLAEPTARGAARHCRGQLPQSRPARAPAAGRSTPPPRRPPPTPKRATTSAHRPAAAGRQRVRRHPARASRRRPGSVSSTNVGSSRPRAPARGRRRRPRRSRASAGRSRSGPRRAARPRRAASTSASAPSIGRRRHMIASRSTRRYGAVELAARPLL